MREFGYSGYHRQLEFEMLSDLTPIDSVDATALRPGSHDVEVIRVQGTGGSGGSMRTTFRGLGGRTHTHVGELPFRPGIRVSILLRSTLGASLFRTAAGSVVAVLDGELIGGPYPDVYTARRGDHPLSQITLDRWWLK